MGYKRIKLLFQPKTGTRLLHIPAINILRAIPLTILFLAAASLPAWAQAVESAAVRTSAAYAEIKLRRTEVEAEMVALSADYTPESPRIVDLKTEVAALDASLARLVRARPADPSRFTTSLGKLLVRHAALSVEAAKLVRTYTPDHPEVVRARRRVEVFDRAIKEILP